MVSFLSGLLSNSVCKILPACLIPEQLLTKEEPGLYHFINQGCLDVDGMDDKEEMQIADVRYCWRHGGN